MMTDADDQINDIDGNFTPQSPSKKLALANIWEGIPAFETGQFIGRRPELRELGARFVNGSQHQLVITGVRGQGKTALATCLAQRLEAKGYYVVTNVATRENRWFSFLPRFVVEKFGQDSWQEFKSNRSATFKTQEKEEKALLQFLLKQAQGKILFFFDNVENIQNDKNRVLQPLNTWIAEITRMESQGTKLLLTSRYNLSDFPADKHYSLQPANISDFTAYIQQQNLNCDFDLNRLYQDLKGNFWSVKFFLKAQQQQPDFIESLQKTQQALSVDMAIATLFKRLPEAEQKLLTRLLAYQSPVPIAGIEKLQSAAQIQHLLDYALLETQFDSDLDVTVYQISPLVREWLEKQSAVTAADYALAAQYQYKRYLQDKSRLSQAFDVHKAWQLAKEPNQARRFALDEIIPAFGIAGLYKTLLNDWLPDILKDRDKQLKADALNTKGKIHYHQSEYQTALQHYEQSLAIKRDIVDKPGEATTLNNISQIFQARGDYDTALEYLEQSLAIIREIGDKSGEATTFGDISGIYIAKGNYDTALKYLHQSLEIIRDIGDKPGEATTLNNISQIHYTSGDYDTTLEHLHQSLAIIREIGDKLSEGTTLHNISQVFQAGGDYDTAFEYLQRSLAIRREIGDKPGEATTLNNISQVFQVKGDYDTALKHLQQSLAITQEIGDKPGEGTILNNISQILQARGDYDTALSYLHKSLAIMRETGNKSGEGTILNNIYQIYDAKGNYDMALSYLQKSLEIIREIGDTSSLCVTLFNTARIHLAREENEQALAIFVQVYQIATKIGENKVLQALENLANSWKQNGLNFWQQLSESESSEKQ